MRDLFISELAKEAKKNKKIVLVVGDLGYGVVEPFQKKFPERFFNAGVAEQSMMGIAAGLAHQGFHVFVYSIANFPTFRCAEQIRNDIDYHNLPVTIVSAGAGLSYGNLGYSHHAIQDYGLIRSFPKMVICSPLDNKELKGCLNYLFKYPKPSYLRLDKSLNENFSNKFFSLKPGKLQIYKKNKTKNIIISTGSVIEFARNFLKKYNNYNYCTIPIWGMKFKKFQSKNLLKYDRIITLEDHLLDCGFGSWLMELLSLKKNQNSKIQIISKSISSEVVGKVGNQKFLNKKYGPKT